MTPLEELLRVTPEGTRIDQDFVRASVRNRLPSLDEAAVAVRALGEMGVLREGEAGGHRLDRAQLRRTEGYRIGVREATSYVRDRREDRSLTLLGSVPVGIPATAEREIRNHTADLRAGILEIISSARERIVLASPFWDRSTVEELGELLGRRLEVGVAVDILGRFGDDDDSLQALAMRFSGRGRARIFSWHAAHPEDPLGSQTFHFKAAVADGGDFAYVGSANLTISGLRSRMELGVLLRHEPAFQVACILDAVLSFSRPATNLD
jgi:phosphatidylserine/phosphatidylglycerophosphate/cardiolipin synthase-like enzyme